jgi:galactose mutarotase-like enzyme
MNTSDKGRLELHNDSASVVIDLDHGGRVASLVANGYELLVTRSDSPTPDDPLSWGAYPMVPWAGRVDRGRFRFGGRDHRLPINLAPHALHGTGFAARWELIDDATIAHRFRHPWPFAGTATQSFTLEAGHLETTMTVRADDPMPLLVGWHPWFRRRLDTGHGPSPEAELDFGSPSMYELDGQAIPTGHLVPCPPGPWDNCFTNLDRDPRLRWAGLLTATVSSSCDHWVVFDQRPYAICVEPQSGAPDEFNRRPAVLDAGQSHTAWYRITWSRDR